MVMAGLQPSSSSKMLTTKRQKHRRGIRTYRPASLKTYRTLNSKGRPPLKDVERGCVKRVADSGIQTKQGAPEGLGPGAVGDRSMHAPAAHLRQIVPDGYTLGWNNGGTNLHFGG